MLKIRIGRFLTLLLVCGALIGGLYLMDVAGLVDKIFPNLKTMEGVALWMPLLPPIAVCLTGQFLGDMLNFKFMNNGFFLFIKRLLFLAVTVASMFWFAYSFEMDYSVSLLSIESSYISVGFLGTMFVYIAYVLAYIFWSPKKHFPFFPLYAVASALAVDYLLCLFWPDGGFWASMILIIVPVVLFFAKPDDRLFEDHSGSYDPRQVAEELSYFDDPDLRPGLARDYDERGYYFGARCGNCKHCRQHRDNLGFIELYCALTHEGVNDHDSCDAYKRK